MNAAETPSFVATAPAYGWNAIGASVRGASHLRSGTPNQDALALRPFSAATIAAVADGHGGPAHGRSDRGARIAVEVAVGLVTDFVARHDQGSLPETVATGAAELPGLIVAAWRAGVTADLMADVGADAANQPADAAVTDPKDFTPYGSTLLVVAATEGYVLYLQLGDGDIVTVAPDGEVRRPIERDANLFGNETTSLCQDEAELLFRVSIQHFAEPAATYAPLLILLATDGYANSFASDDDFLSVARDYHAMVAKNGLAAIEPAMQQWLNETSAGGSGDDITAALIARPTVATANLDGGSHGG